MRTAQLQSADCFAKALPSAHLRLLVIWIALFGIAGDVSAQKKKAVPKPKQAVTKPVSELARLREEFVKATNEYKASLEKLRASYEKSVEKAETRLARSKELFSQGLISRNAVEADERLVAEARDKVAETHTQAASADTQIAQTLLEADAEAQLKKIKRVPRGGQVSNASFIRFNGGTSWLLTDSWKIQRFFLDAFKKPLPISVFGQGSIHERWRLDHRNAMDISLHPDGVEGQSLLNFLRVNGIPFLAFRGAIPGTATGPHIHIGRPSHRF